MSESFDTNRVNYKASEEAETFLIRDYNSLGFPHELKTAVGIHYYNCLCDNPQTSSDEVKRDLRTFKYFAQDEKKEQIIGNIPTIGLEIEVTNKIFVYQSQVAKVLEGLGFRIGMEPRSTEIRFPPSASSLTQAKMLLELRKLGAVPLDNNFASLHINLVVPDQNALVQAEKYVEAISDLLTYAFVPAGRISKRDYSGYYIHSPLGGENEDSNITPITNQPHESRLTRIELRTPRVFGPNTYRLLKEIQLLGWPLINFRDKDRVVISNKLVDDVKKMVRQYDLKFGANNEEQGSKEREKSANAIRLAWLKKRNGDPINLIDDARRLMTKYALQIQKQRML